REGCAFCTDFVSRLADISIGSVGSPDGYSTVIVRSKKGRELLEMTDYRSTEVDKREIVRVARLKQRRADKNLGKIVEGL
ncbi:MAG: Coenzyme F420 hydrogenase/dehydrogenase, beta subunit C-terminal domain, partial [Methanophagales archaeon]|nr:Coenzyme F420 hydrogenase/dehydrogenase, beta subunit C-terminal domain [Methanophagales archaeon]